MFKLIHKDKTTKARLGKLMTAHGEVDTPVYMPVGTQGTVKALTNRDLDDIGAEMILGNAYHIFLRPGLDVIKKAGSLHRFMNWNKPILTDSGGYQIFSLATLRKLTVEGVEFSSHIDGAKHFLTPEKVIEIQQTLGSDVMMPLDECVHYPAPRDYAEQSLALTTKWARRSRIFFADDKRQLLFGIVQGSTYLDLRKRAAEDLVGIGFDGYAIGGVSVGEPRDLLYDITEHTAALLPEDRPRYLMGVGTPPDIVEAIARGADMFDCVVPTRNGRNGQAFTFDGDLQMRNAKHKEDQRPIEEGCDCYACRTYSRSYIRHLFNSEEILGLGLVSLHNLRFYVRLIQSAREAIAEDKFGSFRAEFIKKYYKKKEMIHGSRAESDL